MLRLCILGVVALAIGGCASNPSTTRDRTPYNIDPNTGDVTVTRVSPRVVLSAADSASLQLGENGNASAVALPTDRAWAGLVEAFKALDLEVTQIDPVGHAIAGRRVRSRRPFGGESFAQLMDCGETAGIPNAARWEVTMQVATKLVPRGKDSTIVATWVLASAKPGATSGDATDCTVNERIAGIVASAVQQHAR